ncbi:MAG: CoA transferase [Rhodospirillaceae bacterium]|nr:MAG: CoA transferase [Rhodospirillaceae bacterium]
MGGVLKDIRVLDFGRFIAGPYCACVLAEFGAEVIRVERITGGEDRFVGAHLAETGEGPMFLQHNRNKRSLALDPTTPEGREVMNRLVATADVVIANLPWDALPKLGLDYESLKLVKPDIILATMSTFGHTGPYAPRVGFDGVAQAMSGGIWLNGTGDGQPVKAAAQYTDFGTALASAVGILIALRHRDQTGEGQIVEGCLLKTALMFASAFLMDQGVLGEFRTANSNRSQTSAPSGVFRARDGWLIVQAATNPVYRRWARLVGDEQRWLNDPRYKDDISRGNNPDAINQRMEQWCGERGVAECVEALERARIPAAPVLSPQEVLEDAHITETGMLRRLHFPGIAKPAPAAGPQLWLSKTPGEIRTRPPMIGEHSAEILQALDYAPEEIARLEALGVIGTWREQPAEIAAATSG